MLRILAVLVLGATAFPVKLECLVKENVIAGNAAASGATVFDWTDEIVKDFNSQSVIVI